MDSALNKLKTACIKKPFKSFKDLAVGEYIVNSFVVVETKNYGQRIRINLDEYYMYLPERFQQMLDAATIAELNGGPKVMIYSGKDATDQNRLILDFQDVAYFANQFFE
ncbi:hypothetical protein QKK82_gp03 [Mayetiola barley midge adintovirus]|uniref:hypothetical protein n=1 Tax=Mayetiola barley midge adintovirus TaxID=2609858 RepID=UPI002481F6E8|nr:hypothetical protein QKK82_gp03 [Mayetiola barley midge adintovirus]DAC81321.1 TPA_asm: hypothetical protein [Mayetiola barley midge adintovirus]